MYYISVLKVLNSPLPSRHLVHIKYNLESIPYDHGTVCKLCKLSGKPDNILKMLDEVEYHESCLLEKYTGCPGEKINKLDYLVLLELKMAAFE